MRELIRTDLVLTTNNLLGLARAFDMSKKTFNRILLNLFWASIYNLIGIPIAAGVMTYLMFSGLDEGFYHFPWELFAGFGMMSWLIREGLKLVSDVKKELEK